ncbi:polysulfide reductase NrfD [Candidatus Bathyarchaeota archaeon]|jgi:Ni/Fe-hydrogenase subunit HybB-like protein|nr:polysulfide reductase NrfD [Candidatus Bathyarchaeota archaeon]MBT4319014.1 polysulfide reductase NrfD [Candidatus Bathyarchaeota archaeon]MBT4423304.1 polysulfide reductase NrfD [Candidatus Bathyarchaeota archaeon]MBT6604462.1 polysulfide reductase NrfD [Candidatus Bathyarchaeota archaeon]MBT7185823.1 polysulfide reductase NrfD [Candidatus Bathyarchaeota archaeon]
MENHVDKILESMENTGQAFYATIGIFGMVVLWGAYAWYTQFTVGMQATGLNNTVMWGLYIATFMFMIGVSHAGIIISTTIRVFKLDKFKPISRIAEGMTLVGLAMAVLSVVADIGRPDRILVLFFNLRIGSPLAWDLIILSLYFASSAFYLLVSMKHDISLITGRFKVRDGLYKILGGIQNVITPKDPEKYENMLNSISIVILPFPLLDSGMVVAFIFSLLGARPALNAPFIGAYFLVLAIVTGIAAIVIVSMILSRVYEWDEIISEEVIMGLGNYLRVGIILILYFIFNQHFTIQYVSKSATLVVSNMLLFGSYATLFWGMIIAGFVVPVLLLILPNRNKVGVLIASVLSILGLWINCVLVVVPALTFPNIPFNWGSYIPSWVEWSVLAGILALGVILYAVLIKLIPIVELD